MSDTGTRGADEEPTGRRPRPWWQAEVEGRPLTFWIGVGLAVAAVTLGFGAWWTYGLDRGTPMAGGGMGGQGAADTTGMAATDVRLPPVAGLYAGQRIFFVHPTASDPDVAGVLTEMMSGSPVLVVPSLAEAPASAVDEVYVFTDGVEGGGPFGFQPDVFPSVPGDDAYRPLRRVVLVSWTDGTEPRVLGSAEEIRTAAAAREISLEQTDVVVNMPVIVWPGGQR